MNSLPLYTIIFKNGDTYIGGKDRYNSGWLGILPNKPIKRIFYRLPDNNYLCLEGYEKYFHMIEATNDLTGRNKGKTVIRYAYIIGKRENKVESYRISLFENKDSKYKIGDIVKREFDLNSKFANGLNLDNWRG